MKNEKHTLLHEEATSAMFRDDLALATAYFNDVLVTGDEIDLMLALRSLSKAFGGIQEISSAGLRLAL